MRELNELQTNPLEGIRIVTSEENMLDVTGIIQGPGEYDSAICWFVSDRLHVVLWPQRVLLMQAGTSASNSTSHQSSQPHHRNVNILQHIH